jgi:hypothetical protein
MAKVAWNPHSNRPVRQAASPRPPRLSSASPAIVIDVQQSGCRRGRAPVYRIASATRSHCAPTTARWSSTMRLRNSQPLGQIPTFMALAQRCGSEMRQGDRLAFFGLIRESLEGTRAPACVGFCANPIDPDGKSAHGLARSPAKPRCGSFGRCELPERVRNASPEGVGYTQAAGSGRLRRALPISARAR